MAREGQIKYNPGEGDPNCAHPNMQIDSRDDIKRELDNKEKRRRIKLADAANQAEKAASNNLKRAAQAYAKLRAAGSMAENSRIADLLKRAKDAGQEADGKRFEQKVAEEENAKYTNFKFNCPNCGLNGDVDVVTDTGIVKECKVSASAASEKQYNKLLRASARIFGAGTVVHMAVPAADAAAVVRKFKQNMKDKVQKH